MIQSAGNYRLAALFNPDEKIRYEIPKYQREYVWGRQEWDNLYEDLADNPDHFLGSMICINKSRDSLQIMPLEIIDGQQRLLTVSLLLLAIRMRLSEEKGEDRADEELLVALTNLKNRILQKSDNGRTTKVIPTYQNNNHHDYLALLNEKGLLQSEVDYRVPNAGNRRIYKTFRYFEEKLKNEDKAGVYDLLDKINSASMVKIEVANHADAFTLFESLNNRGVPLSPMDIIKNKALAKLEHEGRMTIDAAFQRWSNLVRSIPEYRDQERFLRQYYNAFRYEEEIRVQKISRATRSKLINIYEELIDRDPEGLLERLVEKSDIYGRFIAPLDVRDGENLRRKLFDLQNVGGAPGYTLLLYMFSEFHERQSLLIGASELLVKYFIRRNITDFPGTRDLDRIFIDTIDHCEANKQTFSTETIRQFLTDSKRFASDERFEEMLLGDIYDNPDATRFVLTKIEETKFTRENKPDLWERDKSGKLVWTIEHIFPRGESIPDSWVNSIANGNRELAEQLQDKWVNKIGNLTISGYNQHLSTFSFLKKRDRKDSKGRFIGYKNGLFLNEDLKDKDNWTIEDIQERTKKLAQIAFELFKV